MKKSSKLALSFLLLIQSIIGFGQSDTIYFKNGNLEGTAGIRDFNLDGWFDCGKINFPSESPPDVHTNTLSLWQVSTQPKDGSSFVSMVVRDNATYESISQRVSDPLIAGLCYTMSIYIARSPTYISKSHLTREDANYTQPVVLKIYGGLGYCNERELLVESIPIVNEEWMEYTYKIKPKNDIRSLTFQAFYKIPVLLPYNGHILIDNISPIVKIACDN